MTTTNPKQPNRIQEFRTRANLTQLDLARLCGLKGDSRICNYERGRRTVDLELAREIVWQLNRFVDCTLDDVFPPKRKGKPKRFIEAVISDSGESTDTDQ